MYLQISCITVSQLCISMKRNFVPSVETCVKICVCQHVNAEWGFMLPITRSDACKKSSVGFLYSNKENDNNKKEVIFYLHSQLAKRHMAWTFKLSFPLSPKWCPGSSSSPNWQEFPFHSTSFNFTLLTATVSLQWLCSSVAFLK